MDDLLNELARALRELHRAIIESERRAYESGIGALVSPGDFLHLLVTDGRFAWLRALSELMVDLDVFLEADPSPTEDEAAAVRAEVERLISAPAAPDVAGDFAKRYLPLIAADPHVAMAHARVKQAVRDLPAAGAVDEAKVLHDRHRWAEMRRHRR
ncbi:MAG: hypothetical protein WCA17_10450 [Burkholderiales bacterium]